MTAPGEIPLHTAGMRRDPTSAALISRFVAILVVVCCAAAVISDSDDWQPISLVVALALLTIAADSVSVVARGFRLTAGLMCQVVAMALLGPAPAVAIGLASNLVDSLIQRAQLRDALHNMVVFTTLGLIGGLAFDALRAGFDLGHRDTTYALLVMPVYAVLAALNLILVARYHGLLAPGRRLQTLKGAALPSLPLEVLSAVVAASSVLVWAHAGLAAVAALLGLLVIIIPLARTVADAVRSGDDLLALRFVSDERAAEVARLSSDRERLMSELFRTEERERARLAESLHDGPMQRLIALRQDAAEREGEAWSAANSHLEHAIAETRALISAFHPATVRELGFESSLRAAIAPFPGSRSVRLAVDSAVDDRFLAGTVLLPVAQELVVNAVKHASPTAIDVTVRVRDGQVAMVVADDGVGIDETDAAGKVQAGHLGLAMVRRRTEDAGGVLDIETRSDGGTRSRVTLPIDVPPT